MSWPPALPMTPHQETPACWSKFLDLQTYINASAFQSTRDDCRSNEGNAVTEQGIKKKTTTKKQISEMEGKRKRVHLTTQPHKVASYAVLFKVIIFSWQRNLCK